MCKGMKKIIESSTPPLIIDIDSRWKNTENGQIYRPLAKGFAWESDIGSIYPFAKGTQFTHLDFMGIKLTYIQK